MPSPLLIPAIAAGASLIGQGMNVASQGSINKKTRRWNEMMYNLQRQHALQDWDMQNAYNSPTAQMSRFRDAGLSPHLIYGQKNEAGVVRSTNADAWRPEAPRVDLSGVGSSLLSYYDVQMKEAQIDNLEVQNTVNKNEALLKAAQVASTVASTDKVKFETGLAKQLEKISLEAAGANLRKLMAEADAVKNEDVRRTAQHTVSIRKGLQELMNLKASEAKTWAEREAIEAQMRIMLRDQELKDLDLELKRLGIQPGDNMIFRLLGRWWDNMEKEIKERLY